MDVKIIPSRLFGAVETPSSKSVAHRMLICAALCDGTSKISGVTMSKDISATIGALTAIGAKIDVFGGEITVKGISLPQENADIDCIESGSTLRFLIPVAAALGINARYFGQGKLPERPITPYLRELSQKNISFNYNGTMPFTTSGKLSSGEFCLEGDISSQFITGLLFALPILQGNSRIKMLSPLQSKPYVDITIDCLKKFGVKVSEITDGYEILGGQSFFPTDEKVEGDFSQAAFFYVANALGSKIDIKNIPQKSFQGDKKILEILKKICYNDLISKFNAFSVDVSSIPDLVPILAVLGCFGNGISKITNASRLRLKESDRLFATTSALNSIGGNIEISADELIIHPIEAFCGGTADSFNDHRIVMALAIASTKSTAPIVIKNAQAVEKSYPNFFDDFNKLGGISNVINLEP
ncbi:MAG: 3-phosphoshikimate 1-carboxyvinyltransferase [Oscillospiraceae bacterium]